MILRGLRRSKDLLARYCGEEFLVALASADLGLASELAEALRRDVEESTLGATISSGVCKRIPTAGTDGRAVEELIVGAHGRCIVRSAMDAIVSWCVMACRALDRCGCGGGGSST